MVLADLSAAGRTRVSPTAQLRRPPGRQGCRAHVPPAAVVTSGQEFKRIPPLEVGNGPHCSAKVAGPGSAPAPPCPEVPARWLWPLLGLPGAVSEPWACLASPTVSTSTLPHDTWHHEVTAPRHHVTPGGSELPRYTEEGQRPSSHLWVTCWGAARDSPWGPAFGGAGSLLPASASCVAGGHVGAGVGRREGRRVQVPGSWAVGRGHGTEPGPSALPCVRHFGNKSPRKNKSKPG